MKFPKNYLKVLAIPTFIIASSLFTKPIDNPSKYLQPVMIENFSNNLKKNDAEKEKEQLLFNLPVVEGRFISDFSPSRFHPKLKRKRRHTGVDIGRRENDFWHEPILAAHDGLVEAVHRNVSQAGNLVEIRANDSIITRYLHLRRNTLVKVGDSVKSGDTIAYMGLSGSVTGQHLHFEAVKKFETSKRKHVPFQDRYIDPKTVVIELFGINEGDYVVRYKTEDVTSKKTPFGSDTLLSFFLQPTTQITQAYTQTNAKNTSENLKYLFELAQQSGLDSTVLDFYGAQILSEKLEETREDSVIMIYYRLQLAASKNPLSEEQKNNMRKQFGKELTEVNAENVYKYVTTQLFFDEDSLINTKKELLQKTGLQNIGVVVFENDQYVKTKW